MPERFGYVVDSCSHNLAERHNLLWSSRRSSGSFAVPHVTVDCVTDKLKIRCCKEPSVGVRYCYVVSLAG